LGTVSNSTQETAALLTGEEDILTANCANGPCLGAFGRWSTGGAILQTSVVHTGNKALNVTSSNGLSIKLKLRASAGFMDRKKGYMASAWLMAKANSDPAFSLEFCNSAGQAVYTINVVQEYAAAGKQMQMDHWVKLERLIPYEELSSKGVFTAVGSNDYLQVRLGKASSTNTNPVYIDDVRLYPADASFSTQNYDQTGLLSSKLDAKNEPTFFEYDIWRNMVGARNANGMVSSSSTVKLINE
jgi:hypothetical protein